ncbi:hypothetical protein D6825_02370 [Candidatus Woesearchaeota archaeon]|nr:MAG: hypothetical protein D6825_02370 [Candidatus Woesearchaeota archaeon]
MTERRAQEKLRKILEDFQSPEDLAQRLKSYAVYWDKFRDNARYHRNQLIRENEKLERQKETLEKLTEKLEQEKEGLTQDKERIEREKQRLETTTATLESQRNTLEKKVSKRNKIIGAFATGLAISLGALAFTNTGREGQQEQIEQEHNPYESFFIESIDGISLHIPSTHTVDGEDLRIKLENKQTAKALKEILDEWSKNKEGRLIEGYFGEKRYQPTPTQIASIVKNIALIEGERDEISYREIVRAVQMKKETGDTPGLKYAYKRDYGKETWSLDVMANYYGEIQWRAPSDMRALTTGADLVQEKGYSIFVQDTRTRYIAESKEVQKGINDLLAKAQNKDIKDGKVSSYTGLQVDKVLRTISKLDGASPGSLPEISKQDLDEARKMYQERGSLDVLGLEYPSIG